MNTYKKLFLITILFASLFPVVSQTSTTIKYPNSFYIFRDESLNDSNRTLDYYISQYSNLVNEIKSTSTGFQQEIMLARAELYMGKIYRQKKQPENAGKLFDTAIDRCKKILKKESMIEAYLTQAECISQNCIVKNTAYAISQGPKIKTLSQKVLDQDPFYGTAKYTNNSQNIFTPAPFCNYKEGLQCLNELLTNNNYRMDKVDYYHVYSAMAYVYIQEKDFDQARYYVDKALELYPENQYLAELRP